MKRHARPRRSPNLRRATERPGIGCKLRRGGFCGSAFLCVEAQIAGPARPQPFAAAHDVLGRLQGADQILFAERLDQAAKRQIGDREARRVAAGEQAGHVHLGELGGHRKTGRAVRELQIDEGEIGPPLGHRRERADTVLGDIGDGVERIELDQMAQRFREQRLVFHHQDVQHCPPLLAIIRKRFDSLGNHDGGESKAGKFATRDSVDATKRFKFASFLRSR